MSMTRQQLEQQLVAAHRTKNVQAAQQAAYAIRAYDQNVLSAQVPSINAPPPIDRVPKPSFGSWLGNVTAGIGEGLGEQVQGIGGMIERGVTAFAQDPLKASAAAFMTALEPARQGFTQPVQAAKDVGTGIVETGKQMYQQATSGPIGLGQTMGQMIDLPGPSLPGGKRRPTMAELDVYHGTPHTFDPETGAPLGRFRSSKIGTGEGAQAYGYGLYLAEDKQVGEGYRSTLSNFEQPYIKFGNKKIAGNQLSDTDLEALKYLEIGKRNAGQFPHNTVYYAKQASANKPEVLQRIEEFGRDVEFGYEKNKGALYKVDLPDAKIEQMLDWDKPLSQQPEAIRKALSSHPKVIAEVNRLNEQRVALNEQNPERLSHPVIGKLARKEYTAESLKGQALYELFSKGSNQAQASEYLRSLGIPGIKYLDAGSRAGEKGTRNFVVFPGEEQSLTILERDGVKAEVPKPDELAYHGTTKQAAAAIEREGFDLTRAADGTVWLTSNPNIGEVAATGKGGMVSRSVSGLKLGGWDEMDKYSTDELIAKGYDGLRLKDGDEITYQIFNPEKLKVPTKAEVPKAAAPKPAASTPRVATWFSGGGTVESALPNHERVMAAEYNPQINAAANKALGTSFPTRDVNKIDPQELKASNPDLFHASPVCKNFSAAKTMRGATDLDRESANSVANAIRVATPPVVTIENVPQYADTALFRHITDALDEKGYKWDVVIHDAADYGAPQSRKRMLLRAVREGELPPLPPKTGGKDWFGAVSDLLPDAPDSIIPPVERRRLDDMIAAGKLDPSKPIITMGGSGFKGTWSAANAGQVAPTLKAANEKPRVIMPDGTVKTVTGRMMARLMGLGDDVPVPDSPTLAKTVLGNGISGDVTRALIVPLLNRTTK